MFEGELINLIAADPLISKLSTYRGRPSIFSKMAPEEIEFPYIVINIDELTPPDNIITRFQIDIDVYDWSTSEKIAREIVFSLSNALDNNGNGPLLQSERFSDIRIRRNTVNSLVVPDPRGIQYHLTFHARGSREYWSKTIIGG